MTENTPIQTSFLDELDAGVNDPYQQAIDQALEERRKKGRTQVKVKPINVDGWFGEWQAQSIQNAGHLPRTYKVMLRSLKQPTNACTCPDFLTNRLDTCKHIEAVLHYARQEFPADQIAPKSYVYLKRDASQNQQIRLMQLPDCPTELQSVVSRYFTPERVFKGRLPDDFLAFQQTPHLADCVDIAWDVVDYLNWHQQVKAQKIKQKQIFERLQQNKGRFAGIRQTLTQQQIQGVAFLASKRRAILADSAEQARDLQALTAASWLLRHAEIRQIMIVSHADKQSDWLKLIDRLTGLRSWIARSDDLRQLKGFNGFVLLSYELLTSLRDMDAFDASSLLILDQVEAIADWQTPESEWVKRLPHESVFLLAQPDLMQQPQAIYSLMQVVDTSWLGPLWRFAWDYYCQDDKGKITGYQHLDELQQRIRSWILMRESESLHKAESNDNDQLIDGLKQAFGRNLHSLWRYKAGWVLVLDHVTDERHQLIQQILQQDQIYLAVDLKSFIGLKSLSSDELINVYQG